jgi:hypothetical protein
MQMLSRRNRVGFDDDSFLKFIAGRTSLQIGCLGRHGWPHMASLWFAIDNGAIILVSYSSTIKIDNLRRDQRVTLFWEDGDSAEALAGAIVYGHADLIHAADGPQAMERVVRYYQLVLRRHSNHQNANHQSANQLFSDQEIEQLVHDTKAKKTAIIVRPEKVCIWGHSDRCGVY